MFETSQMGMFHMIDGIGLGSGHPECLGIPSFDHASCYMSTAPTNIQPYKTIVKHANHTYVCIYIYIYKVLKSFVRQCSTYLLGILV